MNMQITWVEPYKGIRIHLHSFQLKKIVIQKAYAYAMMQNGLKNVSAIAAIFYLLMRPSS